MSNPNKKESLELKKDFIFYFLNKYQLGAREAIWILNLIKKSPILLEKISFVDSCMYSKIGITMRTINQTGFDLSYYSKGRFISNDAQAIYNFFNSLAKKDNPAIFDLPEIHIQLIYQNRETDHFYQKVKLDNIESDNTTLFEFKSASLREIDSFLETLQSDVVLKIFKNRIEEALSAKNEELFQKTLLEIKECDISLDDVLKQ